MKTVFPEFYKYDQEEFKDIFNECYFVIDTNVLLNLYRYSETTADELLEILKRVSDRLWMPYQVGIEYHFNRVNVILDQQLAYDNICQKIDSQATELISKFKKGLNNRHPKIHADTIAQKMQGSFNEIITGLKQDKEKHPNLLSEDRIRDTLNELYAGKIGEPYTQEQLEKIYEEGTERYKKKTPPGFEDEKDKKDKTKEYDGIVYLDEFGDLVVWKQIMDKAKNDQKPIIFVTDDVKEDWWQIEKGRTIGPRVELLNEFRREVEVPFYMYKSEQFINQIQLHLSEEVNEVAIKEIEDLREYSKSSEAHELEMTEEEVQLGLFTPEQSREFYKEYSEFLLYSIQEDLNRLKESYSSKEITIFYKRYQEEYNKLIQDKRFVELGWLESKEFTTKLEEFHQKVLDTIRNREAHAIHKD
ncbi:PIN-like domain-containing protein [Bacillus cereus group sp. BfR-BA-01358]|uniref:PIN-like domain-containing protein n=1 Tax=Bacillus cereus group sp. BfR-BA-01358 TaxID=2920320 RepID=UPI001F59DE21|nr:PIN domain-containing protein [Bacillus cereus group sp. BfR-BA-01358]